jgi:hypothetical protein
MGCFVGQERLVLSGLEPSKQVESLVPRAGFEGSNPLQQAPQLSDRFSRLHSQWWDDVYITRVRPADNILLRWTS